MFISFASDEWVVEGLDLGVSVVLAALFGIVLVIMLWWLYFDYVVLAAEQRLARESGHQQAIQTLCNNRLF